MYLKGTVQNRVMNTDTKSAKHQDDRASKERRKKCKHAIDKPKDDLF